MPSRLSSRVVKSRWWPVGLRRVKPAWKFATTVPAWRPNTAPIFSNLTSPRIRRAPASVWPWCSRSCWRTAGRWNVNPTSRAGPSSEYPICCRLRNPPEMPPDVSSGRPRPPRILIVDDDAGQRSLLDSFLKSQGFDTVPVSSGERALEALRGDGFNMMISDVRMPGLSGLETLRRARQEHALLPVLLVTAYADIRDAVGAMRDGAVNYLAKPIDLDELLATVRQATGLSKSV